MFPPSRGPPGGDAAIRSTDNDAALARLSTVKLGYFNDPYIKYFVPRAAFQPPRPPLINVGTYVRSAAIDTLVNQWLSISAGAGQKCQIISLGSGSDTRFWRIAAGSLAESLGTYIEVDFSEITSKKAMAIRKSKELSEGLGDPERVAIAQGGTALYSSKYHLLPMDLRVTPEQTLEFNLVQSNLLDPSLPTLILFECVLAYMSPAASSQLIQWFVDFSKKSAQGVLGCIIYEMFGLNDAFGRVMINNLRERNIQLPGVEPFTTIDAVQRRFLDLGFSGARALTLKDIRRDYISKEELERISTLEFLDEVEELDLVLSHYAVSWGLYLANPSLGAVWGTWGLMQQAGGR